MKPLMLTMQAFSTYLDKTVIDFRPLNEKGLYLITGDTGAGKTTIFDAICFALYGEASGSDRGKDVFRSQYAPYSTPTIVELTFQLDGKDYQVSRRMSYTKTGKKRNNNDDAVLIEPDGRQTSKQKDVTNRITELLKVDYNQFKQIVMIAQGEFARLLTSPSKEKETIFRQIFHTESFKLLEMNLHERAAHFKTLVDNEKTQLDTSVRDLHIEGLKNYDDQVTEQIENLIKEKEALYKEETKAKKERDEKIDTLTNEYNQKQAINETVQRFHHAQKNKEDLLAQADHYQELEQTIDQISLAKDISTYEKDVLKAKKSYKQKQTERTLVDEDQKRLDQKKQDFEQDYAHHDTLKEEISALQIKLSNGDRLKKVKADYDQTVKDVHEKQTQFDRLSKSLSKDNTRHEEALALYAHHEEELETYSQKEFALRQIESELKDTILPRMESINELSVGAGKYRDAQEDYYHVHDQEVKATKAFTEISERADNERKRTHGEMAGILAKDLKEGTPCPVCGSIHHPKLAVMSGHVLSFKELEKLEKQVEAARQTMMEVSREATQKQNVLYDAKSSLSSLCKTLQIKEADFNDMDAMKTLIASMMFEEESKKKEIIKKKEDLQAELAHLEDLSAHQKEEKERLDKQEEKLKELDHTLNELHVSISTIQYQVDKIVKEHPYLDREIKQLEEDAITLNKKEQKLARLEQEKETLTKKQESLTTLKNEKDSQLQEAKVSLEKAEDAFSKALQDHDLSLTAYQEAIDQVNALSQYRKNVEHYHQEVAGASRVVENLAEQLGDQHELIDLSALKETLGELKVEKNQRDDALSHLHYRLKEVRKGLKEIQTIAVAYKKDMKEQVTYHNLDFVISGKTTSKMSFERYVLAAYFEMILRYANEELKQLSEGRYEFVRRREAKGNAGAGLDLDILDYETGAMRDVKSLSGGEKFKASLSLALGLSNMIQSMAGGIELNALFIDEGFGTLDHESIETAMDVLISMKSENKVIGIISHVDTLKDRIDAMITVTRGRNGSHLKVTY